MPGGRKTFREEFQIKQRYADLAEPFFKFLKTMFEEGSIADKKWAVEQLGKGYVKMIPQTLEGGDENNPLQLIIQRHGEEDNKIT